MALGSWFAKRKLTGHQWQQLQIHVILLGNLVLLSIVFLR